MIYTVLLPYSVPHEWLTLTPETGEVFTARYSNFALFEAGDLKDVYFFLAFQAAQGAQR